MKNMHENKIEKMLDYTVLDSETTTHAKGHPFHPLNKLISYAYKDFASPVYFKYFSDPDFSVRQRRRQILGCYVGFNFKFDYHWMSHLLDVDKPIWDCQLAEHVYTGQHAQYVSLNECLEKYGLETKKDIVKELWEQGVQTDEIPVNILQEYNEWDVLQTEKLFLIQQQLLSDEQKNLVYLMGEDLKVLASIERSGLLFDAANAASYLADCKQRVAAIEASLSERLPPILHGTFNWDSGDHLSCFLYGGTLEFDYATSVPATYKSGAKRGEDYIKNSWHIERVVFQQLFKPLEGTELKKTKDAQAPVTRYYQTDAPTLQSLKGSKENKVLLGLLQERSAVQKVAEMLESIFKLFDKFQWQDNLIHGQYNQNVAVTGRLSSSSPNMQNSPPEIDKFFISRYND